MCTETVKETKITASLTAYQQVKLQCAFISIQTHNCFTHTRNTISTVLKWNLRSDQM